MEWFARVPIEIFYVLIAAFGGITRYLQFYLNEGAFAWQHFIAHVFISSFSGYMFYQFATNVLSLSDTTIPIFAGIGGWMGVEALKFLEAFLKKKIK
jgi:ABC-type anion transport system duplicated permease subunit